MEYRHAMGRAAWIGDRRAWSRLARVDGATLSGGTPISAMIRSPASVPFATESQISISTRSSHRLARRCGATGNLSRRQLHTCPSVSVRTRTEKRQRKSPLPASTALRPTPVRPGSCSSQSDSSTTIPNTLEIPDHRSLTGSVIASTQVYG